MNNKTKKRQKYYLRITYAVFAMLKNNVISVKTNISTASGSGGGIKMVCSNVMNALFDRLRQLTITPRMPTSRLLLGPTTHLQFLSPNLTPQLTPLFVKKLILFVFFFFENLANVTLYDKSNGKLYCFTDQSHVLP